MASRFSVPMCGRFPIRFLMSIWGLPVLFAIPAQAGNQKLKIVNS